MKKFLVVFTSHLLIFVAASCSQNSLSQRQAEKRAVIARKSDLVSFDSAAILDQNSLEMIGLCIEGLTTTNEENDVIPAMAQSWSESEDGLSWTFQLREACWSDGSEVSTDDFLFAWNRAIQDPANQYAYLFGDQGVGIENAQAIRNALEQGKDVSNLSLGIEAQDAKTLIVHLQTPCSYFAWMMSDPVFYPINEKFYDQCDGQYGLSAKTTLANGPYKLSEWDKDASLLFVKNDSYWEVGLVKLNEIEFKIMPDVSASALAYQAGEVDFAPISGSLIDRYKESSDLFSYLEGRAWFVDYNAQNTYLKNRELRLALSMAINRSELVENVLKDGSKVLDGLIPYNLSESPDSQDFREINGLYFPQDPKESLKQAQEHLKKAKEELGLQDDPIELDFIYDGSYPTDQIAQYLYSQWKALDSLEITMSALEHSYLLDRLNNHLFDLALCAFVADYADPLTFLNLNTASQIDGGLNYASWSNEAYDQLISEAAKEADESRRYEMLLEAEKILMDQAPLCGLFQASGLALKNPDLTGLITSPVGNGYNYKYLDWKN